MKYLFILLTGMCVVLAGTVHAQSVEGNDVSANFVPDMVTDPELCDTPGFAVKNKDVAGLSEMLNKQMLEMATSASANIPELREPETEAINFYISQIEGYQKQVNDSDPMDYNTTHKLYYCLLKLEGGQEVSSLAIRDLLRQWTLMNGEMVGSNSAQMPAGYRIPDNNELTAQLQHAKNYMAYLATVGPQTYPRQAKVTKYLEDTSGIARDQ